jgi:hypothetical protein
MDNAARMPVREQLSGDIREKAFNSLPLEATPGFFSGVSNVVSNISHQIYRKVGMEVMLKVKLNDALNEDLRELDLVQKPVMERVRSDIWRFVYDNCIWPLPAEIHYRVHVEVRPKVVDKVHRPASTEAVTRDMLYG